MIPDTEVERVRETADIASVIGEYIELRRMGADFRGPCPFHQGTHRNFSVSPRKRMYYCFVCHEAGDVFTFIQKRLGLDWPDAVRHVAAKVGIELHETKGRQQEGPDPRQPLWEANAAAAQWFQSQLREDESGRAAREYLAQRDVDHELAERFGLGWAPRDPAAMQSRLNAMGINDERLIDAGLLVRREEGGDLRPRFLRRLIFPIVDVGGRHVGFGGRLIAPGEPKYLNTGESVIYSKGNMLYHLHEARLAARREDRLFLVEGYFDVLRVVGAGIEPVVAPLGTALTDGQAQLIKRYTPAVFLLYDSDKAGLRATFRAGDILLSQGLAVRVITLPEGEDPDTFVRKHGREALERAASTAIDVFERKIQILERGGWFADLHKRRQAIDRLLPTIRATTDAVMREIYLARAAEVSGVDRGVLLREAEADARRRQPAARPPSPASEEAQVPTRQTRPAPERANRRIASVRVDDSTEETLIRAMLADRAAVERIAERLAPDSFRSPVYRQLFTRLLEAGAEATLADLAEGKSDEVVRELERLYAEREAIQHIETTVEHSLLKLDERRLRERNAEIDREVATARGPEKDELLQEKVANAREISRLHAIRHPQ